MDELEKTSNEKLRYSNSGLEEASEDELVGTENPHNWSKGRKWLMTVTFCVNAVVVTMGSSIFTPGIPYIAHQFDSKPVVVTTALSTYVLGFAVGPLIMAPMSEVYGRSIVQIPSWLLFCLFQLGCALAQNVETLIICRLFVGIFGSPAVTVAGGIASDIWAANEIGPPLGLFTMSAFLGPVLGPIIGGYCIQNNSMTQGWRWCFWVLLIISGVLGLNWIWFPETYRPVLVRRKTGKGIAKPTVGLFANSIKRPLQMLFLDPIVFLASCYISYIFGIIYLFFTAYPLVYMGRYHFLPGESGLAFLGIGLGVVLSFPCAGIANKIYISLKKARGLQDSVFPEGRLPLAIVAAFFVPVSMFWFAWTGKQGIHWIVPILSGVPFGLALTVIFISLVSYIAEGYLEYAASAVAASTILRSVFSAGFPLFARSMYNDLGPEWAGSLLGFVSIAFLPVPWLFWEFGPKLRRFSKFRPPSEI